MNGPVIFVDIHNKGAVELTRRKITDLVDERLH